MRAQVLDAAWEYLKQHQDAMETTSPVMEDVRPALLALRYAMNEIKLLKAELKQAAPFVTQFQPTYRCEVEFLGSAPVQEELDLTQDPTTPEHVRQACMAAGITSVDHHRCGCCNVMVQYLVRDGNLYFDSGCMCSSFGGPELRSWSSASDWINMQTQPEHKDRLRVAFGLPPLFPPVPAEST